MDSTDMETSSLVRGSSIMKKESSVRGRSLAALGVALCVSGAAVLQFTGPRSSSLSLSALDDSQKGMTTPLCYEGRVAPTLFVVGCQKCATTSLWEDAVDHIYGLTTGLYKEHHYFHVGDTRYVDGTLENYVAAYPGCDDLQEPRNPSGKQIVGADFDPQMGYEDVPGAIKTAYMDAFGDGVQNKLNFVSILRDPVNRTLSYFYHALDEGWLDVTSCDDCCASWWVESSCNCTEWGYDNKYCCTEKLTESERMATCNTTFDHWVDTQLDRAATCVTKGKQLWPDCGDAGLFASLYVYQIENFLEYFRSSQFSIIPFDMYTNDAAKAVAALANVTGMRYDHTTFDAEDVNTNANVAANTNVSSTKEKMLPETAQKLIDFFEPYNALLYELIDQENIRVFGGQTDSFMHTQSA
uniref:Sulfotransferase domain-containing protein n=1 Tax=Octactis speculum TaxID=3111310 RepID=A0A7S2CUA2_9STRA|mmetsp:Transcript_39889/g.54344  ORF Transcript_39889/g.54344 Transcript_39889/m.54344 type:complete len:411 (+) Transcript_39889:45-1277(+)|eukprot:CAMPEP_0185753596 /NCGR_PEP_ID=MMETSP1174-20130828/12322_1 /TAXON_ID=35687 /ORGANISM="Dictyocha speculum, Strain CCMP1381" /LENGTH=410 /DNA_ID=CAMNT_0028431517 /DNA_START=35 /DNA_END=1267 /DNA_ORIENTATION=-